jgi:hypothetical protein
MIAVSTRERAATPSRGEVVGRVEVAAGNTVVNATAAPVAFAGRRHAMIAEAAYYIAERRGFEPGHELEDWLCAEREICSKR